MVHQEVVVRVRLRSRITAAQAQPVTPLFPIVLPPSRPSTSTPTAHGPCALQQPAVSRARPSTAVSLIGIVSGHARAARGAARRAVTSAAPPKTNPFRDASAALHTYTAHDGHRPALIFTYYFRSGSVGPPGRRACAGDPIFRRAPISTAAPRDRGPLYCPLHLMPLAQPAQASIRRLTRPHHRLSACVPRHSVSVGSIHIIPRAGLLRPA